MSSFLPRAWTAAEADRDPSWILRLTPPEAEGIDAALVHARAAARPELEMTAGDFPLDGAARDALKRAFALTQGRWGMCLLKGLPVERWSEADTRLAYWGISLHVGIARPQNRASALMADVRNEGSDYKVKNGRGYNTNASLDFHMDSCDVVGLLCRRPARSGGESKVVSTIALRDELQRLRPDLVEVLKRPFFHSYQGAQGPGQPPYYACPILGSDPQHFAMRFNRKNTVAAQNDFPAVPRLTPEQIEALDLMDVLMADSKLCFSMQLERGDLQLLNNYVTSHSRTNFEDHDDADLKRHLLRLWIAVPGAQPLPPEWQEYFGDVRAGAVRGGLRGSGITPAFERYEERQAVALGMAYRPWAPFDRTASAVAAG